MLASERLVFALLREAVLTGEPEMLVETVVESEDIKKAVEGKVILLLGFHQDGIHLTTDL